MMSLRHGFLVPLHPPPPPDTGVISASDPFYFPGFQLLVQSLHGFPVTLFDLGLSPEQRQWCMDRGIALRTIPLVVPATLHGWQTWNKPFYLEASPYEHTLWLDADCVVRGSLGPLFQAIAEKPVLIRHWDAVYAGPNDERLYDRFPTRTRFASTRVVNAGVIGIRKSRDLPAPWFRAWREMVTRAASDAQLRALVSFHEESMLIWALEESASVEVVSDRPEWNRFIRPSERGDTAWLAREMQNPTEDLVWHLACNPKMWCEQSLAGWMLPGDALAPYDLDAYPDVLQHLEWSVDRRHIYWLYDVLASGRIRTAVEIGCLHGATSTAFVEALNRGKLDHATFCDIAILPSLRETAARAADPHKVRIFQGPSVDLLDEGRTYDFAFLDGDHRLEAVSAELDRLLRTRTRCIMAHDTNATAAMYRECEGAASLKHRLQALGWHCLEDSLPRPGEKTHRGMFFATRDPDLLECARASLASRCDTMTPELPELTPCQLPPSLVRPAPPLPLPPPPPRPTAWRHVLHDAAHVARCKVRKGWLW